VLWEELTHQNVSAQMVNTLTKPTSVEIVTTNVKLVSNTEPVLNVWKILSELPQICVTVMMDIMMTIPISVKNVTSNVPLVKNITFVSLVPVPEFSHHNVTAQNTCGKSMNSPNVNTVLITVMVVTLLTTVKNVN